MTKAGVEALRICRAEVLELVDTLTEQEWEAPSDCEGWRVQDVIAHLANSCRSVADPDPLAAVVPGDLEATHDLQVEAHRTWTSGQVRADYEEISRRLLDTVAAYQEPRVADTVVPIENAGEYPLHLVADALTFDHYCHLRNDLLQPNGPLERSPLPAHDVTLRATLNWLIPGLPQMNADPVHEAVTAPIGLRLKGPGGGDWTLRPGVAGNPVRVSESLAPDVVAVITSTTEEFVIWSTHRRPWREREVRLSGNVALAESVLDAVHLF